MEPHNPYSPSYFPHQPGQLQPPPLPAWARTFRTILLILAGLLVLLLLLLFGAGTTGSADMYSEGGLGVLQATIWLGLGTVLLTIPYVTASIIYAALWAGTLRGRGYRRYPGTTWILIAGPIVAALPVLALIGVITTNSSRL
ncbi:hypothetical protein M1D89_07215 [Arthrobacter sp. D3-18]